METTERLCDLPMDVLQKMSDDAFSKYYELATKPCGNWEPGMDFSELETATLRLNEINDELERRIKLSSSESKASLSEQVAQAGNSVIKRVCGVQEHEPER